MFYRDHDNRIDPNNFERYNICLMFEPYLLLFQSYQFQLQTQQSYTNSFTYRTLPGPAGLAPYAIAKYLCKCNICQPQFLYLELVQSKYNIYIKFTCFSSSIFFFCSQITDQLMV
mgnify:CR=1 FL=1